MAKCYDNDDEIKYAKARQQILFEIYNKNVSEIPEEKITLELDMKEAEILFRLLGHHIVGVGDAHILRNIFREMRGTKVDKGNFQPLNTAKGSSRIWIVENTTEYNDMKDAPKNVKITLVKDDIEYENCEWFENAWCIVEVDQAGPYVKRRIIDPEGWK